MLRSRHGRRAFASVYRIAFGTLVLVAIATEFSAAASRPHFNPANFFSFFTIVSNTFGALVFLYAVLRPASLRLDLFRGAAVTALTIVGVVFAIALAGLESEIIPWVNTVLHDVMPIAAVADWVIVPPSRRLTFREGLTWLVLPLLYVAYTLIRGALVHWYPYPFLDANAIGYPALFANCTAIGAFAVVVVLAVIATGNSLRRRSPLRVS